MSVCSLSIYLFRSLSPSQSLYLSIYLSICLSVCLPVYLFHCQSASHSLNQSINQSLSIPLFSPYFYNLTQVFAQPPPQTLLQLRGVLSQVFEYFLAHSLHGMVLVRTTALRFAGRMLDRLPWLITDFSGIHAYQCLPACLSIC